MAHLLLRQGYFYCRATVPPRLRDTLQRTQLWKSLRTRSRDRAVWSAKQWGRRVARLFRLLHQHGNGMTREQIDALIREYVSVGLEAIEENSFDTLTDERRESNTLALTDGLDESTGELLNNNFSRVTSTAGELLQKHGLQLDQRSLDWKRLCRGLLMGFQDIVRAELRHLEGHYAPPPVLNNVSPAAIPHTPTKLFSEVSAVYFKENRRAPRTDAQIQAELKRFLAVIGGDKPIGDISKADCRQYKEVLLKSIGATTINKHLHSLAHLFQWAAGQGFIPEDHQPIKGLLINKRIARQEKQDRKPFTDAQLTSILTHPDFTTQRTQNPDRYWLVLCLLYSGARREEIAQLHLTDISSEGGVPFFHITNEGEHQSLKNLISKRRVPIHSALIHAGFLDHVAQLRRTRHAQPRQAALRLFPSLVKGKNGYGDAVGKYFHRLLRHTLHLVDPALVLHSLRHTVTSKLVAAGVPQDIREVLAGHAAETVHGQTYVHRDTIPLTLLQAHLEKLRFGLPVQTTNVR